MSETITVQIPASVIGEALAESIRDYRSLRDGLAGAGREVRDVVTREVEAAVRAALDDPAFKVEIAAAAKAALLEAVADKVKAKVKSMKVADASDLAGLLFPELAGTSAESE